MKTVLGILSFLIVLPFRLYLLWYLLKAVNATELPMFIFWAYIPFVVIVGILNQVVTHNNK